MCITALVAWTLRDTPKTGSTYTDRLLFFRFSFFLSFKKEQITLLFLEQIAILFSETRS